jgi:hypothetical protein
MFRKVALALVAAASLGVAALSSTAASASPLMWPHHPHHHWHNSFGFVNYGYVGCYQKRLVPTPFGYRWRTVNVCVY